MVKSRIKEAEEDQYSDELTLLRKTAPTGKKT